MWVLLHRCCNDCRHVASSNLRRHSLVDTQNIGEFIGRPLEVTIVEADAKGERLTLNAKAAVGNRLRRSLRPGQLVWGDVRGVAPYGVFVRLDGAGGAEGLLHSSAITRQSGVRWSAEELERVFPPGMRLRVLVIAHDAGKSPDTAYLYLCLYLYLSLSMSSPSLGLSLLLLSPCAMRLAGLHGLAAACFCHTRPRRSGVGADACCDLLPPIHTHTHACTHVTVYRARPHPAEHRGAGGGGGRHADVT